MKSLTQNQGGASALEFALVLPVLLTLIFGMIEFSLFLFNRQILTNAAREGARIGVIMQPISKTGERLYTDEDIIIKKTVVHFAKSLITFGDDVLDVEDVEIIRTQTDPDLIFGTDLLIKIKYKYKFLYLSQIFDETMINTSSNMSME